MIRSETLPLSRNGLPDELHPGTRISVAECWARDGLQSWPVFVPTETKVAIINAAIRSGFDEVEVTSFVPERTVPQFRDALEVLAAVDPRAGVRLRVLAPNLRGAERACQAKADGAPIDTVGFPISASEAHNVANLGRDHRGHMDQLRILVPQVREAGLTPVAAVATAFGCPLTGPVQPETVLYLAEWLADLGVGRLMLSDTTGLADPFSVAQRFGEAARRLPAVELIAHFHDTRGSGMVNTFAALAAGVRTVDSCLGGLGGEPATVDQGHAGETGNVVTEDLVVLLARSGLSLAVDPDDVVDLGRAVSQALAAPTRSQVLRTGPGLFQDGAPPEAARPA